MPHVLGLGTPGVRSFPRPPGLSLGRALGDQGLSGEPRGTFSSLCSGEGQAAEGWHPGWGAVSERRPAPGPG